MTLIKKITRIAVITILAIILLFIGFLLFFTIAEYRPAKKIILQNLNATMAKVDTTIAKDKIKILSWNLGYCALDKDTDFVLDGGTMSRGRSKRAVKNNLSSIITEISRFNADVYFLQEIGVNSDRSYHINQLTKIIDNFKLYNAWFAVNYKCLFVPFPLNNPMGGVLSGLATFSRWNSNSSVRYQLPGNYAWPVKIFHLKRCIIITQFSSKIKGKCWFFINIHLSAYDSNGSLRKQQLGFIKQKITDLYDNNNFVVIGGDWNSLFPAITKKQFGAYTTSEKNLYWVERIPKNWSPQNWQWAYDRNTPTCRADDHSYVEGENFTTTIDGFLVSPNLEIESAKAIDLKFTSTDHNPVLVEIKIKELH